MTDLALQSLTLWLGMCAQPLGCLKLEMWIALVSEGDVGSDD
jgi:hypothetical protein